MSFFSKSKTAAAVTYKIKAALDIKNPHSEESNDVIDTVVWACLWLSTLSGTNCLGQIQLSVLPEFLPAYFFESSNYLAYYGLYVFCYFVGLWVCHLIDFFGINIFVKFFAYEIALLVSGEAIFSTARKIKAAFWAMIATSAVTASFVLSWYGSELLTNMTSRPDKMTIEMIEKSTQKADASLLPNY